jgi:effector-binding domain-containing protein
MLTPLVLALALHPQAGGALPDAVALLDRREAALGTLEARAKVHGIVIRGRIDMTGSDVSATFEERHLLHAGSERVLHRVTWGGWGATTQGTDGTVSWSTDGGMGILVKEGASQGPPRRLWAICRSAPWRSMYAAAVTRGVVERDGRRLYELEMKPREGASEGWYLDAETNELARVAVVYPGPSGESLPMEWSFGDWKAVDGVLYPHRRVQELMGSQFTAGGSEAAGAPVTASAASGGHAPMMTIVYVCESIAHAELEPAEVAPPPEVAEAIRDPQKRAQAPGADAEKCTLETHEKELVASIRVTIPEGDVSKTLATLLPEVVGVLSQQRVQPSGPPFSRYHRIDHERHEIEIEAGISVRKPFEPKGRVQLSELPAGRTAVTWHIGPYDQLQRSYGRLGAWIESEKLAERGPFWEVYWTDPGLEPDPSTWRTQILWPVK